MSILGGVSSLKETLLSLVNELTLLRRQPSRHDVETRMKMIEVAMEMADNNKFGKCSTCGCELPSDRVLDIPTLSACDFCQRAVSI